MKIIGFAGPAGVGKNTAALALSTEWQTQALAIAGPLYDGLSGLMGMETSVITLAELCEDRDYKRQPTTSLGNLTPRRALQLFGDWVRETMGQDYLLKRLEHRIAHLRTSRIRRRSSPSRISARKRKPRGCGAKAVWWCTSAGPRAISPSGMAQITAQNSRSPCTRATCTCSTSAPSTICTPRCAAWCASGCARESPHERPRPPAAPRPVQLHGEPALPPDPARGQALPGTLLAGREVRPVLVLAPLPAQRRRAPPA